MKMMKLTVKQFYEIEAQIPSNQKLVGAYRTSAIQRITTQDEDGRVYCYRVATDAIGSLVVLMGDDV